MPRAFVDSGYTLVLFREIHANPDYPVALPVWSELERGSFLPPRPMKGQAGAPKKGPQARARIRGHNDNCRRGRGDGGGRGGSGSGSGAIAPVHGMSSVRSYIGDLGVGGHAGAERPPARVWGPLAAQRYGMQDTSQRGHAAGVGGGGGEGRGQTPRLAYPKGRGQVPRLVYPKERGRVPRLLYPKTLSICRRSKFVHQLVSHFAGLSEGHIRGYFSCVRVRGVLCFGVACVGSMRLAFRKCGGEAGPVPMPVLRLLLLVLDTKNQAERVRHRARVV